MKLNYSQLIQRCESVTTEEMKSKYPIKTMTIDFGNRMRGQGKRVGKMIRGGMCDISIRGCKSYIDRAKQFNLSDGEAEEVNLMQSHEWLKYWRARTADYDHDMAVMYAWDDDIIVSGEGCEK